MVEQRVHTVAEEEWEQDPAKILERKLGGRGVEQMGERGWGQYIEGEGRGVEG